MRGLRSSGQEKQTSVKSEMGTANWRVGTAATVSVSMSGEQS